MEKLILKWLSAGIINQETADVMLKDVKEELSKRRQIRFNICIYTLAAVLIGFGVFSFISANDWLLELFKKLPIMKIAGLLLLSVCALFFGHKLAYEGKTFPKLGFSLIFLSTLLIGGTYALVGQTYNINAHNSSLMLLWLLSVLPVAYIYKKLAINILSIIIYVFFIIFYYMDLKLDFALTWTIFIPLLIGISLYSFGNISQVVEKYNKFSLSYKLSGLAPVFVTLLVLTCSVESSYELSSLFYIVPVVFLFIADILNFVAAKEKTFLFKFETAFLLSLLIVLFSLLTLPEIYSPAVTVIAHFAIISMILAGYNYGYKFEHNGIIVLTNSFLIIYLTVTYCRWGWDMLDKSLFFMIGGIGLLGLGIYLEKRRKQIIKKDN